jgi:hypothetical protein
MRSLGREGRRDDKMVTKVIGLMDTKWLVLSHKYVDIRNSCTPLTEIFVTIYKLIQHKQQGGLEFMILLLAMLNVTEVQFVSYFL